MARFTAQFSILLDKQGGGQEVNLKRLPYLKGTKKTRWIHLDYKNEKTADWIKNKSGLDEAVIEGLLDEDTHPRYFLTPKGLFVVLRSVNQGRNADVDDMIALHFWIEGNRIITVSHRSVVAVSKVREELATGVGPTDKMDCFCRLIELMTRNISKIIEDIAEEADDLEERIIDASSHSDRKLRSDLSDLRHKIVGLRRYLAPQRDVFNALKTKENPLITPDVRELFTETSDELIQAVEELNYARDHTSVSQEELDSKINLNISQTMYILSIVTVIFMPLTLITGLLGSNIGGIPWQDENGFWTVTAILTVIGLLQIALLKKFKLF